MIRNRRAATTLTHDSLAPASGSIDDTSQEFRIQRFAARDPTTHVRRLRISRNSGKWIGLDTAKFQIAACAPQVWHVAQPKATSLQLYFSSITASDDQVIVSAMDGSFTQVYELKPEGIATNLIPGKAIMIEFRPIILLHRLVAMVVHQPTNFRRPTWRRSGQVKKESVCGNNNTMVDIACIKEEYPTEYHESMEAMRASRGGTCTAWLWGDQDHILTNHHCFSSQVQVDQVG